MIKDIQELNFPKIDGKQYATLSHADVNIADMGEKTITTQVKIDGDIVPDFSYDWEVVFQGEKYIQPLRKPQGAKENTSLNATVDLTFQHWAIWQLKRYPFVTIQPIDTGNYIADEEVASVQLNLGDFCSLFGQVLEYYYGEKITIDFNDYKKNPTTGWHYDDTATLITISHTKIWNVLIDVFYNQYAVRWEIAPAEDNDNNVSGGEHYIIRVGYPTISVDHIFECGFEGGLLKVERQVQSDEIRNVLKGRGGEKNVPFRYFRAKDENNPDFASDPDWVEELENIYFPNLMGATFRSYVQGWKAAHASKYGGYTPPKEIYSDWAFQKGYTDTKFSPVEFVADEITTEPESNDSQIEILPDYAPYIKKGSSIDKYGPIFDTLDNNEDIFPTIQGTGMDIAVDVEQILTDDTSEESESDAKTIPIQEVSSKQINLEPYGRYFVTMKSPDFTVPEGKHGNLYEGVKTFKLTRHGTLADYIRHTGHFTFHVPENFFIQLNDYNIEVEEATIAVVDAKGNSRSASGIPAGTYHFEIFMNLHNLTADTVYVVVSCDNPQLVVATINENGWKDTFDIWVKNIWETAKYESESDSDYANRVWKPILGDREGNEAKVVFTSGMLVHEDYEFIITAIPTPDTSHSWTDEDGETHNSEWRITLAKSDAELEATGLYIPNTKKQGAAGDTFAFIGTEMTHIPYVRDAEIRLDDWKKDQLLEKKDVKPTFVVTTDRVRINNEGRPDALINSLKAGNAIRITDKRFITDTSVETLYLQSVTYKYREPTSEDAALNPDVEIILGTEYIALGNQISTMQGEISALQKQVGSISNIEQVVRRIGNSTYLRKDITDRTNHNIIFGDGLKLGDFKTGANGGVLDARGNAELLTAIVRSFLSSPNFVQGLDGEGWKLWMEDKLSHLEIDRLTVRQVMTVFELLINKVRSVGGQICVSAANGKIKTVEKVDGYYKITFEQENTFVAHDLMRCQTFTGGALKSYWVEVAAVDGNSVLVAEGEFEDSLPAEADEVVLMGNTEDTLRQNLILISATEDGQPRFDVMDGINNKSFTVCLRARLGNLDGINDSWFPAGNQPHGDGLYADNAYLRGTFLLSTGEDIKTKFEIVEGMISSAVESVRQDFAEGEGFLSNPLFADGFNHWSAESDTGFLTVGNRWIWANGGILSKQGDGAVLSVDRDRTVINIKNTSIVQKAADYYALPEIETNADGKKKPASVYLSFLYKVRKAGRLIVHFEGLDKTGFEDFSPLAVRNMALEETEDYRQFTRSGLWNGTGDFTLRFTGEISVCMIVLSTDRIDALTYTYKTLFEQSEKLVKIAAENFDEDGNILGGSQIVTKYDMNLITTGIYDDNGNLIEGAGLVTTPKGSGLFAFDNQGGLAQVGAYTEDGEGIILLKGDKIRLEGAITANGNVTIDKDGRITAVDGTFSGSITANSGKIGLFTIDNEGLYYGEQNKWYDGNYKQNLAYITPGAVRIQNEVGVFGEGDVANIKVAFGDYADPSLEVDDDGSPLFNFRGCSAGYIYRQSVSLPPYEYFPAVKIISDNAIGKDVALYTKGAIVCQGGLWGAACIMDVGTGSDEYNVIAPDKGSTILLRNPGGARLYMPKLAEMKRMMQTDGAFAVPLRIVSLNGNGITTMFFNDGESKTNFLRTTGDSKEFIQLSSCNTVDILLIYNGTDDFYAIVK